MAKRRLLAGLLVLTLVATPAAAGLFPVDPIKIVLLARIAATAAKIYSAATAMVSVARDMKDRQQAMFPDAVLGRIESYFQDVRSVEDEIAELACSWRFSPRTLELREGLLRRASLCKEAYQRVFGKPIPGPDEDLDEYTQWTAVRRMNTVASTFEANGQWTEASGELARRAREAGTSVGEATRIGAIASAMRLQQATVANKQAAELLSGVQEDLDIERTTDRRRKLVAKQWLTWMVDAQESVARASVSRGIAGEPR